MTDTLDEVIATLREALGCIRPNHIERGVLLVQLGDAYVSRFERLRRRADLDDAVRALDDAETLLSWSHPSRLLAVRQLGRALTWQFSLDGASVDRCTTERIDRAIWLQDAEVKRTGHLMMLPSLATSYHVRWESSRTTDDLDRAVSLLTEYLTATRSRTVTRPQEMAALSRFHLDRYEERRRTGSPAVRPGEDADLSAAARWSTAALSQCPAGSPLRVAALLCRAHVDAAVHTLTQDRAAAASAIGRFLETSRMDGAPAALRLQAASRAARLGPVLELASWPRLVP